MIPVYQGDEAQAALEALKTLPFGQNDAFSNAVRQTIQAVQTGGDVALRELAQRFGDTAPEAFQLSEADKIAAVNRVLPQTKAVLDAAAQNIRAFGQAVMDAVAPVQLQHEGFAVGLDWKPVERVGCYVPGGRYPLPSTALMTALTAQVAGVPHIAIVSPVLKDEVIYAGVLAGVQTFYQVGGAQAVAALAFGTQSIASVDMVVGPGNAYVTEAKRQLQGVIGIDMLAGPSEVAIIADSESNPNWLALDMLAQAEHDPDARAYLLTPKASLALEVAQAITQTVQKMALPPEVAQALSKSGIFVLPSLEACVEVSNQLAPEHLEVHVRDLDAVRSKLLHYGAVFLGDFATVPFGDYMAGPNHTLPTGRSARFSGSLTPMTFLRPQSWILPGANAHTLADLTAQFAHIEGLRCHEAAAAARVGIKVF